MDNAEAQMLLEGIEVTIAMEQPMAFFPAESSNQAIDCLAYGVALPAQPTVVLGRGRGQIDSAGGEYLEP